MDKTARRLDTLQRGQRGCISAIDDDGSRGHLPQRLMEMGFDAGVEVEFLHAGPFGGDPICVRVGNTQIALRRAEAALVLVGAAP
jgi:ferrous iron transport protein A